MCTITVELNIDRGITHVLACFQTRNYFEWTIKQLLNSFFALSEEYYYGDLGGCCLAEADNTLIDHHNSLDVILSLIQ